VDTLSEDISPCAAADLQRYARRRLERAPTDAERGWWQEVMGAVA
jgi:hypothetical protein